MKKFNDYFAAVFCISLVRRPERREAAQALFDKHGITVEFIEAVDGKELDDLDGFSENLVSADGQKVSRGDLGCTMSHLKVAEIAKQRDLANYFVFEDDVELPDDFSERFDEYMQQFDNIQFSDWYMLYLGANHENGAIPVTKNIVQVNGSFTTHAFAVNNIFFNAIINVLSLRNDKVDVLISSLHKGGHCYCFDPNLATQAAGFSDILEKQVDYKHLRNRDSGGVKKIYVPLNVSAQTILEKHFKFDLNVNLVNDDLLQVLNNVTNPDAYTSDIFNSGTGLVFLCTAPSYKEADHVNYGAIKTALLQKVKGSCAFIGVNMVEYEFAEIKSDRHFEGNITVILHNNDWDGFALDASNQLIGFNHVKKYFPPYRHNSVKEDTTVFRNGQIDTAEDLYYKLQDGFIDYNELLARCTIDLQDKPENKNNINIIIPVNGRLEYNEAVCNAWRKAVDNYNIDQLGQYQIKVGITIVEHSDEMLHRDLTRGNAVNYIHIPMDGKPFNKSLAQNIGAIEMQLCDSFIFHDVDIIVPENFFFLLYENIDRGLFDALQCFTKRRVLNVGQNLTKQILEARGLVNMFPPGTQFAAGAQITEPAPGAPGGSMFVSKKAFLKVGGFNDVFFKEYSLEDQHFFDKLDAIVDLGFCDYPEIEMLHLAHPPAFAREVNDGEVNAFQQWRLLTDEAKLEFVLAERKHMLKFITWEDFA